MPYLREVWSVLLDIFALGAERGNTFSLALLFVVGVAALFAGRRLFWLLAALVGYLVGAALAPLAAGPVPLVGGLIATAIGVIAALLAAANEAVVAYPVVFIASSLVALLALGPLPLATLLDGVVAGSVGLLSVILLRRAYDPILILLSAFYGAVAILGSLARVVLGAQAFENGLLFALLMVAGIATQLLLLARERRNPLIVPASAGGFAPRQRRARRRYRPQPAAAAGHPAIPLEVFGLAPEPAAAAPASTGAAESPASEPVTPEPVPPETIATVRDAVEPAAERPLPPAVANE